MSNPIHPVWLPNGVLSPSPSDEGECDCGHDAVDHWLDPRGNGCEGNLDTGCNCTTYRPKKG